MRKTASASGAACNVACRASENRNKTFVRSIRQTGAGHRFSRSDSRTTQLLPWTLPIPSRCPDSACKVSIVRSTEYQHMINLLVRVEQSLPDAPSMEQFAERIKGLA